MPKMTPGYAKNTMRRTLQAVVDTEPTNKEISILWEYFGSACAYCGLPLKKENREGHIDHLVSTTKNGVNHISNRVLILFNLQWRRKRRKSLA
jgi:5-methylcytosine-specific restriction endonuclease McrA